MKEKYELVIAISGESMSCMHVSVGGNCKNQRRQGWFFEVLQSKNFKGLLRLLILLSRVQAYLFLFFDGYANEYPREINLISLRLMKRRGGADTL